MTSPNTSQPLVDMTTLIALGKQTIRFLLDVPHDDWREAASECSKVPDSVAGTVKTIKTAVTSVATAGRKTAANWRRHGRTDP